MLYLLPLASALIYPIGGIFLKRGMAEGGGFYRGVIVSNLFMAACFPLLLFFGDAPNWEHVFWPVVSGIGFFLGQLFTVIAIRVGDVSVQAPLMGTKVVFVAVYSTFLKPDEVPPLLWFGATVTAIAVFLIGGTSLKAFRKAWKTILFSLISCAFFGLTDTLVGYRSQEFGAVPFIVTMTMILGGLSFLLLPFVKGRFRDIPRTAWKSLAIGGGAMGLQAVILNLSLTTFGQATAQNIVYSSRGLFGVLIIWLIGSFLGNREALVAGPSEMRRRLAGSVLLCVAIAIVIW